MDEMVSAEVHSMLKVYFERRVSVLWTTDQDPASSEVLAR